MATERRDVFMVWGVLEMVADRFGSSVRAALGAGRRERWEGLTAVSEQTQREQGRWVRGVDDPPRGRAMMLIRFPQEEQSERGTDDREGCSEAAESPDDARTFVPCRVGVVATEPALTGRNRHVMPTVPTGPNARVRSHRKGTS